MRDSIGFIGGGRITAILLQAWQAAGLETGPVAVGDPDTAVLASLQARFPGLETSQDNRLPLGQDIVFLSLHPPVMKAVLPDLAHALKSGATVVSLAPVLTFQGLSALLGGHARLVRMIPNAPSLIGKGFNPVAFGPSAIEEDRARLHDLFMALGSAPEVLESRLEAYAILTAMGPTYFWPQWQTLRELGADFRLSREAVDQALAAMLHGAVDLLLASGLPFDQVMDTVPVKPLADFQEGMQAPFLAKLPAPACPPDSLLRRTFRRLPRPAEAVQNVADSLAPQPCQEPRAARSAPFLRTVARRIQAQGAQLPPAVRGIGRGGGPDPGGLPEGAPEAVHFQRGMPRLHLDLPDCHPHGPGPPEEPVPQTPRPEVPADREARRTGSACRARPQPSASP